MSSETMASLLLIGIAGYTMFKYWKRVLKLIIGILIFCVLYTYFSLKKYFEGPEKNPQKIEQVVQETVRQSTPNY